MLRVTSSSVVDQLLTATRRTRRPCQVEPVIHVVPSASRAPITVSVAGVVAEVRAHLCEHDVVAYRGAEIRQTFGEARRMTAEAVDQVGNPRAAE